VELFDEIWEKVYSAEQQNQKEKFEVDLKKEIKKLQRLRDQIKTWIGSSDVKDKDTLIQTRKLIETKMEQFKICEKETKTKTYSKEGLARAEKLSPEDQAKLDTCEWVGQMVKQLGECVDEKDLEIERLSSGKGKKTNRHIIDEYNDIINSHKFHINKQEGIMRLVMNDRLDHQLVDDMKEEIEYYVESHEEEEYMQSYDEEYFYETLGLDDLDVVNVDCVTQASNSVKNSKKDDESATSSSTKETKKSKKSASSTMIPLTIGRARVKKEKNKKDDDDKSHDSSTPTKKPPPSMTGPSPTAPAARPPPSVNANSGASMAAILKRESEQQEKERQKQAALLAAQQQVSAVGTVIIIFYFSNSSSLNYEFAEIITGATSTSTRGTS
jgi:CCR4-NOT transcription complex subunit 3